MPKVFDLFRGRSSQRGTPIHEHPDMSTVNHCNTTVPSLRERNTNIKLSKGRKSIKAWRLGIQSSVLRRDSTTSTAPVGRNTTSIAEPNIFNPHPSVLSLRPFVCLQQFSKKRSPSSYLPPKSSSRHHEARSLSSQRMELVRRLTFSIAPWSIY